ncbi:MAG: hypothetical protein ANABAC_1903 [Anaerolineae bacterium]|nr:MAG: hypothetical protein ANABAC_1903 [Anaerolineae bacterium]
MNQITTRPLGLKRIQSRLPADFSGQRRGMDTLTADGSPTKAVTFSLR